MDPLNCFLSQLSTVTSSENTLSCFHRFNRKIVFWLAVLLGQVYAFVLISLEDLGPASKIISGSLAFVSVVLLGLSLFLKNPKTINILFSLSILAVALIYFTNALFLKYNILDEQDRFQLTLQTKLAHLQPKELAPTLRAQFDSFQSKATQMNTYRTCLALFLSLTYFSFEYEILLSTIFLILLTCSILPSILLEIVRLEVMIGQVVVVISIILCFATIKLQKQDLLTRLKLRNKNLENTALFFKDWLKNLNCNYILAKNGEIVFENAKTQKTKADCYSFYCNAVVSASFNKSIEKGESLASLIAKSDKIDTNGKLTQVCQMKVVQEQEEFYFECHLKSYKEGFAELFVADITIGVKSGQNELEDKLKKMALAQAVHEFKTPLNSIIILIDELVQNAAEKQSKHDKSKLETLKGLSSYITYLIADIHCYCENSQTRSNLREEVSINEVFDFCLSILHALVKAKGEGKVEIVAHNTLESRNMTMILDGERLKQVILNAISNSVKFTRKGFILLTCREEINSDLVVFEVEDSGKGINEQTMTKIKKSTTAFSVRNLENRSGTGLGIQICQKICKACGFDFYIESKENKGTKVGVTLDKNDFSAGECSSVNSTVLWKEGMWVPPGGFSPKLENCVINTQIQLIQNNISFGVKEQSIEGEAVILVDDVSIIRNSTKTMLTKISKEFGKFWNFIDASDGAEAISQVIRCNREKIPISFIISDECMEYVDGSQTACLLKNLMEKGKISNFSCFSYTSMNGEDADKQFDAVIDKPVSQEKLRKVLQENNII